MDIAVLGQNSYQFGDGTMWSESALSKEYTPVQNHNSYEDIILILYNKIQLDDHDKQTMTAYFALCQANPNNVQQ